MRKNVFGKKLSRETQSRRALFSSLIRAIVINGKIITTKAKAKAILPAAEKLVTLAKNKDMLAIRRSYVGLVGDSKTEKTLFDKIGPAFKNRAGGYVRLTNLPRRKGDAAEMVKMEWTEKIEVGSQKSAVSKKSKAKKESEIVDAEVVKEKSTLKSRVSGLLKPRKK